MDGVQLQLSRYSHSATSGAPLLAQGPLFPSLAIYAGKCNIETRPCFQSPLKTQIPFMLFCWLISLDLSDH